MYCHIRSFESILYPPAFAGHSDVKAPSRERLQTSVRSRKTTILKRIKQIAFRDPSEFDLFQLERETLKRSKHIWLE